MNGWLAASLVVLFLALPPSVAVSKPMLDAAVEATASGGAIEVRVTNPGLDTEVKILLHHVDALDGPIMDRVVSTNFPAGSVTKVEMRDLRPGIPFNLTLVDGELDLAVLDDVVKSIDPSRIREVPSLIEKVVPPISPMASGDDHVFDGYVVTHELSNSPRRLLVGTDGRVVAGWVGIGNDATLQTADHALRIAFSNDEGHTFSAPLSLYPSSGDTNLSHIYNWLWRFDAFGRLHVFLMQGEHDQNLQWTHTNPIEHLVVDPAAETLVHQRALRELDLVGWADIAPLPNGFLLVGGRFAGPGNSGAQTYWWTLNHDGEITAKGPLPTTEGTADPTHPVFVATDAVGNAAIVWMTNIGNMYGAWLTRSTQSATFETAQSIPQPFERGSIGIYSGISLREDGSVMFAATVTPMPHPGENYTYAETIYNQTSYFVTLPLSGPPTFLEVIGPSPDRLVPRARFADATSLAVWGSRVWIYATETVPRSDNSRQLYTFMMESVDGGRTFGEAFRTTNVRGWPTDPYADIATFAGGRPILLGWYHFGEGQSCLCVMPFFDPSPLPHSLVVKIETTSFSARVEPNLLSTASPSTPLANEQGDGAPGVPFLRAPLAAVTLILAALVLTRRRRP